MSTQEAVDGISVCGWTMRKDSKADFHFHSLYSWVQNVIFFPLEYILFAYIIKLV